MSGEVKGGISFRRLRILSIAFVAFGALCMHQGEAAQGQYPHVRGKVAAFRWFPTVTGRQVEQVTANTEVAVPIEADIEGDVSEVIFVIPPKFRTFGITMEKQSVRVKDGKARSKVLFKIIGGMPLGRHDLVVHILERSSKTEIGTGKIPFLILPSDIECLC